MSYLSQLPIELCESLAYYVDPLYASDVFKLECFTNLINSDRFWKNKIKHNYSELFCDDFPLNYYRKLYIKLAQLKLYNLEETISNPCHKKLDKSNISPFEDVNDNFTPLLILSQELENARKIYKEAQHNFYEAERLYKTQVSSRITSIRNASNSLKNFYSSDNGTLSIVYKFYEIIINTEELDHIRITLEDQILNCWNWNLESNLLQVKKFVTTVNERYGPKKLIKCYSTGEIVNNVAIEHGIGIAFRLENEELHKTIYWIDLDEVSLCETDSRSLPYFLRRLFHDASEMTDCQKLYNVPFSFTNNTCNCSCSSSSSSSESSDEE